jgi:hypothetical protein
MFSPWMEGDRNNSTEMSESSAMRCAAHIATRSHLHTFMIPLDSTRAAPFNPYTLGGLQLERVVTSIVDNYMVLLYQVGNTQTL